jgi:hypothetical protein
MRVLFKVNAEDALNDAITDLADSGRNSVAEKLVIVREGLAQAGEIVRQLSTPGATLSAQDIAALREILL